METNYFIGMGELFVAERDAGGNPGALEDVGEVMIALEISKEYKSNYSTRGPLKVKDAHVPVSQEVKGTITLKEPTANNLQLILHGVKTANAENDVEDAAFPAGIVAGESHRLPGFTGVASSLVIEDSAGMPVELVLGTHYMVDLKYGRVKFLSVAGKTQPFKASYTSAASTRNSILTERVVNRYIRVEGINIGNNEGAVRFLDEYYNATLMPASKFEPKGEDYATYEIAFELLADPTKEDDPELGRFGNRLTLE